MDLTPDEVATWTISRSDFERFANLMFNASIAQHLATLDGQSLQRLDDGVLLVDEARILAGDLSYESVYVLAVGREITADDRHRWNFPRFTPHPVFVGLKDFTIIQRHTLGLPQDSRGWADLSVAEQLQIAVGYIAVMEPLHIYMPRITRGSLRTANRATRLSRLVKGPRWSMH
jgi:hypothetical protein